MTTLVKTVTKHNLNRVGLQAGLGFLMRIGDKGGRLHHHFEQHGRSDRNHNSVKCRHIRKSDYTLGCVTRLHTVVSFTSVF